MVRYTRTNKNKKNKISTAKKVGGATPSERTLKRSRTNPDSEDYSEDYSEDDSEDEPERKRSNIENEESCDSDPTKCIICDKDVKFEPDENDIERGVETGYRQCDLTTDDGELVKHAREVLLCKECAIDHYHRWRVSNWSCYICRKTQDENGEIITTIKN